MITGLILSFLIPVILCLIITPWVIKFAHKIGAMDTPGGRKVHKKITPRIGGLAIFASLITSIIAVYTIFPIFFAGIQENLFEVGVVGFCLTAIFFLGFWDDLRPLSPGIKFGVQFIIATLVYFAGFKISVITNPIGTGFINIELIEFPITLLWIVGVTNAFNLIDGLDGLASGVATIASVSIFTVSAISGQLWIAVLSLIFAGSLVGFLRYNFRPAQIFLGDSGSLILGFSLALLSIQSATKISTGFALLFPLLVLGLPIADTLVSMSRRFLGSYLVTNIDKKPSSIFGKLYGMFRPDRSHIHHQLISLGLTHRDSVIVLYVVSAVFAIGAFAFTQIESINRSIIAGLILVFIIVFGIKKLRYREIAIFNNGLLMPLYEKWVLNRTTYLSLIDLMFMAVAYTFSYILVYSINADAVTLVYFNQVMISVLCVQICTFWITGVYRESIRQMGIGNALAITGSVFYSTMATAFILLTTEIFPLASSLQFLILNFYFLLTFVLGFRIAYRALVFWFNKEKTGENVLIYGANENGTMILHKINTTSNSTLKVLGFLDDDPQLEGKLINGYPILGGHWHLSRILKKHEVDFIFICEKSIKPENFKRLQSQAELHGIHIKELQVRLENINPSSGFSGQIAESVGTNKISYI